MSQVSLIRINLLRVCYMFLAVGLGVQLYPRLFGVTATVPFNEGVVDSMLSALALTAIFGIVSPLRMMPILVFEVVWKVIWFAAVAFPSWRSDTMDKAIMENLFPIGLAIPFILIIPWGYFFRDVYASRDRWR